MSGFRKSTYSTIISWLDIGIRVCMEQRNIIDILWNHTNYLLLMSMTSSPKFSYPQLVFALPRPIKINCEPVSLKVAFQVRYPAVLYDNWISGYIKTASLLLFWKRFKNDGKVRKISINKFMSFETTDHARHSIARKNWPLTIFASSRLHHCWQQTSR